MCRNTFPGAREERFGMDFRDYKYEMSWIFGGVALLCLLYVIFRDPSAKPPRTQASINYEMPRPSARISPYFSLEGRDVDHEYENPFDESKAKHRGKSVKADKGVVKNVKAKNAKKNEKTKDPRKKSRESQKQMENNEVAQNEDPSQDSSLQNLAPNSARRESRGASQVRNAPGDLESPDDRSEQQWRSLLNAQPTQENMEKLVSAYRRGKVSENVFLTIIDDLLRNQKSETQKIGLLGLRSMQTARAFTLLSEQYDSLNADAKPGARQILLSYGQSSRLDALAQVLRSGNSKASLNALNVIQTLLNTARPDPRDVRSSGTSRGARRYTSLLPAIQQLQQSGVGEIAQVASQIYNQLVQLGVQPGGTAMGPVQQARASDSELGFIN